MEDNEDEPEDVRKATPVEKEIESVRNDEKAGNGKTKSTKKRDQRKSSALCYNKNTKLLKPSIVKSEANCCRSKISRPSTSPKIMSVMVYPPPCVLPKLEIIPRHCLSRKEYIDVLASPSRKCPPECFGKTLIRKVRPISTRINELAQPARRLIVGTLQERGETLPPEMIDNLVKSIEGSSCLTPEQAEQYFRDKENRKEIKGGKNGSRQKCKGKLKPSLQCPVSELDKEAVMCQYLMAERFVKSILKWKCPIPVEEFQDIATVILRRLSFVLEYTPSDEQQDLKSQQMRFLADIIACWISGVLFEVAEEHRKEIEEDELLAQEEAEGDEDEDEDEKEEKGKKNDELKKTPGEETEDEEEGEGEEKGEKEKKVEDVGTQDGDKKTQDFGTQSTNKDDKPEIPVVVKPEPLDEEEDKAKKEAEEKAKKEAEEKARKEAEDKAKKEAEDKARIEATEKKKQKEEEEARIKAKLEEEEKKKKEKEEEEEKRKQKEEEEMKKKKQEQEEEENKKKKEEEEKEKEKKKKQEQEQEEEMKKMKETELKKKKEEEEKKLKELGPKDAIDKIGDDELFKTEIPFVTFGKILDTIYTMIEEEPEGDETDIIHNRIQRSIYEKFSRLINRETPESLTENLKDIVDVISGKIATWIEKLLNDSELKFLNKYPPEVESREIRDWSKWVDHVTDRAGDWAEWIHRVINEAEIKSDGNINRGDWQSWTSNTEQNALLWRRYYLETVHQAHHNKMMMADRNVVKTGNKAPVFYPEEEMKNTDLAD